mmetsp:Transcript_34943/g.91960  ORF Transcript_34943/g.91960 Transcript_34943/m.91960 type:complete len:85 (+) Transcript_34943:3-257(+)
MVRETVQQAVVGIDPERARPDPERMKQLESQTAQAVAIQAAFRGKQVRTTLDELKEEADIEYAAASHITAVYRGHLARQAVLTT